MRNKLLLLAVVLLSMPLLAAESSTDSSPTDNMTAEPGYCQLLQPSAGDRQGLAKWMLGSGAALKRLGCWRSHIYWGQKALATAEKDKKVDWQRSLLLSMASSYFYLGDYDQCQDLASRAEALSDDKEHWRQLVEALYIRSAVARVKQQDNSVSLVELALKMLDQHNEHRTFLRGKVLYNLGATLTDGVIIDLERAHTVLTGAEGIFRKEGSRYDLVRTVIRLARVDYLKGHYESALATLNSVQFKLGTPRSRMLFYQQRAKVQLALKHWDKAEKDIEKARDLAQALDAKVDLDRISQLQEQTKARSTSTL